MLNKLADLISYTALASVFGITAGFISVVSFGIFYFTTDIMFKQWDVIYQVFFTVLFFSIPLFITLAVICAVRAYKKNEKLYVLGMIFGVGPTFYASFIFLIFVWYLISFLS
ncbi:MAG: hypothetical protein LBV71_01995 [Prevotella sp.]|jgi:hypothetical protein|nr:hypothetical protein [Prevotella sp.]